MTDIIWLKQLSDNIANVKIVEKYFHMRSMCGTCQDRGSSEGREIVEIHINAPNLQDLQDLLRKENFVIEEHELVDVFRIDISKKYTKYNDHALYKKHGFDEAFNAMKVLKPKLTEFDFVYTCGFYIDGLDSHDEDLATETIYHGDANCIHNDDGSVYTFQAIDPSVYEILSTTIVIGLTDIECNRDILSKIISSQKVL